MLVLAWPERPNAWPERGASAVKHLKTCLRNSLKKEMLESLLHITINGPPIKKAEALLNTVIPLWKDKKKRRKLPSSHLESFSTKNLEREQEVEIPVVDLVNFKQGQVDEETVVELEVEETGINLAKELDLDEYDDLIDQNVSDAESEDSTFDLRTMDDI